MSAYTVQPHARPVPSVSSPLASSPAVPSSRTAPKRNSPFPSSRPLRPFASISNAFATPNSSSKKPTNGKAVKMIEPPKNHRGTFVLNLTQAEFSRQD
ncbi:hypothetical protein PLICRDRAFT_35879 [Plicaturopsis crispa FD-325 SS-3]|nr:hypothetical protein PLICRDRAFT_35879 [Plicaturopsis crispa FD-325 SS-3]